ncbi:YeeE/YedE family protein [Pseudosulfitobacter pseudonitzschiae]|uniref:Uncharacterized protein n=1 Tax=Pseudosulfitobacter pseudonitzschiae TaxID=1402135 RepID=A0A073J115_9RHOB|nr:YeeE/YedE thiosulfate transporter family protein [Pseudosulfitobacter pseudonitzschiae]KEJ95684.1 hypothetical protein SUH3_19425 [Pseudosulfitobacter pseudonitzschiae]MBM1813606.1 YeeE/YedE family protein [Pseudosulfitobacter pseudonitzschiae]MBM1830599.1 YeeE/YedE family protein [Pseudosulfitobacter pseudonitzschiae]MBM1835466.1 YeeE/YedE family protein [Pseudosulfitobacter pseudonitzschiae]MBM1840312.1 YeeE/YedE family protein [Pseudosulfitobacter pseudonitzschiae]
MEVSWLWGLFGGLIIGTAASILLLGNGRIMGASGILGGLLDGTARRGWAEAVAFVAALIAVPALFHYLGTARVETHATASPVLLIAGGLAVGLGTRLANGCTSGHGVCGISRLSIRGIIATLIYIGAGVATVAGLRALMGGL